MEYNLIIRLSKRFISFGYYKKGNDRFAFLGDPVIPLAIYCNGSDIEISAVAREQARTGAECYYDDVFTFMQQPGTFRYRGKEVERNKIILYAIEKKLEEFFSKVLYGIHGYLVANRANLALCFVFDPELEMNDRIFIIQLFRNAGYLNVISYDEGSFAVKKSTHLPSDYYVALSVSDPVLFARLYDKNGKQLASKSLGKVEVNPKEERLCELIFNDIRRQAYGYNYELDVERYAIYQKVKTLRSTRQYQNGTGTLSGLVQLSNGVEWEFEVDACDIAHAATAQTSTSLLDTFLEECDIPHGSTSVILIGERNQVNDLYQSFSTSYSTNSFELNTLFNDLARELMTNWPTPNPTPNKLIQSVNSLLSEYKSRKDYDAMLAEAKGLLDCLHAEGMQEYDARLSQVISFCEERSNGGNDPDSNKDPNPSKKKFQRDVNVLKRSYLRRADYEHLLKEANDLLARMHRENVHDFDADIKLVIEYAKKHIGARGDADKYKGEVRRLTRGYTHRNDLDNLLEEAKDLLGRMHGNNVHNYDAEITQVIEFAQKNAKIITASTKTKTAISKSRTATNSKDNGSSKNSTQLASNNDSTTTNDAKYRRDVNILMRGYEKRADKDKLRLEVEELLKKMHDDGVFSFDEKLNKVLSFSISAAANSGNGAASKRSSRVSKPLPSSAPKSSDPDDLKKKATTKVIKPTKPDATSIVVVKKTQTSKEIAESISVKSGDAQTTVVKAELRKSISASQSAEVTQKLPTKPTEANKLVLKDKKSLIGKSIDSNDMKFKVGSDGDVSVCLTKCKGDVVVPPTIEIEGTTLFVTSVVEGGMFSTCTNVRSISLPETIVSLENFAFTYAAISSIDLPERLKKVGDYAFNGCKNLTELDLPDSVVKVGDHAFDGCKNLKRIQFHGTEFWNDAISGCNSLEIICFTCEPPKVKGRVDKWAQYYGKVELHVPYMFAADYNKDPIWSRFKVIKIV